jgi:hypothetical protein
MARQATQQQEKTVNKEMTQVSKKERSLEILVLV